MQFKKLFQSSVATLGLGALFALASVAASGAGMIGGDVNGNIYSVNESTGALTNTLATSVPFLSGLAYSSNGTLYALAITLDSSSNPVGSLYTINSATGNSTLIGPLGLPTIFEGDLAFDPTTGVLYGVQNDVNNNLYLFTVNPATGAGTNVGIVMNVNNCQSQACDLSAMAFDSAGNLYVIDTGASALYRVNKATGAIAGTVGLSITGLGTVAGMAIDPATGIAYVATGTGGNNQLPSTSSIYSLNLTTGVLTLISTINGPSVGLSALAFPPITAPALGITKSHSGDFTMGQSGAQYTVTVSNSGFATKGVITVTDNLPSGLTLASMSGSGWTCSSNTCSRSDVLAPESTYPTITVTVNVASNAPFQVTNQVTVTGGGSAPASASDLTNIDGPLCSYSFSNSPASVGVGTSSGIAQLVTSLGACAYTNVISNNPDWIAVTGPTSGTGSGPISYSITTPNNTGVPRTGSFTVFATASGASLAVATFSITQAAGSCSALTLSPSTFTFGQAGGSGTVTFNASPCAWTITGAPSWIALPFTSGTTPSFNFNVAANPPPGVARQATLSVNGGALSVSVVQSGLVCTYIITDATAGFGTQRSFSSSGGSGGINVTAPNGCAWTATSNQSFLTLSGPTSGSGNGTVNYSLSPNSSSTPLNGSITIAGLVFLVAEQASGAPAYTCTASSGVPATVRPEGFAEKVSDIVFTCGGQAPVGGIMGDIRVSLSATITNRLLSTGQTDVLLLEDEPAPASLALGTNAFRGVLTSINGANAYLFPAVQLATAGGGTFLHTWRIVNSRINAHALSAGGSVQATIVITASAPFTVTGQPNVAFVASASPFSTGTPTNSTGQTIQPVSFTEGFATAFAPTLVTGQDPSTPGTVYNAESGFVNTAKLGSQTGFATNGTRLITSIANVPSGVTVYAAAAPASSVSGTNAEITSANASGSGGFPVPGTTLFSGISYRPVAITSGAGTATWEVTASNSTAIETFTFNLLFVNPNNVSLSGITYAGALAPVSSGPAPQLPNTILPVPRFASSTVIVPQPATVTLSVQPVSVNPQGQIRVGSLQPALRSASTPSSSVVGGTVTWTQVQANTGSAGSSTAPNVTVGGTLPPTWAIISCTALDSTGVCPPIDPNNPSNSYSVMYPSLSPGQTGTIQLTAQSSTQTSGSVEYASTIDSDLANADSTDNSFTTNFPVAEIGLNVSLTNSSSFTQGQNGAVYSASVANGGSLPTSLPVTLTEVLPAGLTLVSMAGTGWTCTLSSSSCTRSDVLAPNSSFPAVAITVNVASNAASTVTNQVTAASGVLVATGSDPTNIGKGSGTPAFFNGETSLGSNVFYLQFPNSNLFGYYNLQSFPIFYHYDMGFEAFIDGGNGAAYLYDFTTGHWWYTSSSLFPYLYDFSLNNWLYYFPATNNPGHYSSNPRYFSDLTTGKIITM